MINSQSQKGGDGSTNLQAQQMVVHVGIDEKRAREIYQEMNLQSVQSVHPNSGSELITQSSFSYTYLYLPNEEADLDLIWKNVRIICGGYVW